MDIDEVEEPGPRLAQRESRGARAAQYSKVQESSALRAPRLGSRGVSNVRGMPHHGRTRKPGSDRLFVHRMKEPDEG